MLSTAIFGLYALVATALAYDFRPAKEALFNAYSSQIPTVYNVSDTQLINGAPAASYWTSSFILGSNGHEYLIISHGIVNFTVDIPGYHRASIFDITENKYHSWNVAGFVPGINSQKLNISLPQFQFQALSEDEVSVLHTASTSVGLGYDLTLEGVHPILFNFASGSFNWGIGVEYEWAIPSMKTSGSITVNGTMINIDSKRSFSWYDRQWGSGVLTTGNWTWFELHLSSGIKLSIWNWDNAEPYQRVRAATMQLPDGSHRVFPINFTQRYNRSYASTVLEFLYPLDWDLSWGYGDHLRISSVHPDQELVGSAAADTAYAGFITTEGYVLGKKVSGFGVVEMVDMQG